MLQTWFPGVKGVQQGSLAFGKDLSSLLPLVAGGGAQHSPPPNVTKTCRRSNDRNDRMTRNLVRDLETLQTVKKNQQNGVEPLYWQRADRTRAFSGCCCSGQGTNRQSFSPELFNFTKTLRITVEFVFVILQMSFSTPQNESSSSKNSWSSLRSIFKSVM